MLLEEMENIYLINNNKPAEKNKDNNFGHELKNVFKKCSMQIGEHHFTNWKVLKKL